MGRRSGHVIDDVTVLRSARRLDGRQLAEEDTAVIKNAAVGRSLPGGTDSSVLVRSDWLALAATLIVPRAGGLGQGVAAACYIMLLQTVWLQCRLD